MMLDPFTVLGVTEDADDAEIRRQYLALVRTFPPDRAPERFKELRAAYEHLIDERKRLETKILSANTTALSRLRIAALRSGSRDRGRARASAAATAALLVEGLRLALPEPAAATPENRRHRGR
jgi:curved DNA-binding protein CbpA